MKRTIENDIFCIKRWKEETIPVRTLSAKKEQEETIHQRKGEKQQEMDSWVKSEDNAGEVIFEQRLAETKKDPLFILNPMPPKSLRNAQKTLQRSKLLTCT